MCAHVHAVIPPLLDIDVHANKTAGSQPLKPAQRQHPRGRLRNANNLRLRPASSSRQHEIETSHYSTSDGGLGPSHLSPYIPRSQLQVIQRSRCSTHQSLGCIGVHATFLDWARLFDSRQSIDHSAMEHVPWVVSKCPVQVDTSLAFGW